MENLEDTDPELADEVKRLMFVFEDIKMLDDRAIQTVLGQADKKDLALALKSVGDEVKEKILRNMSKRAAASMQEDMDFMGPVRLEGRGGRAAAHRQHHPPPGRQRRDHHRARRVNAVCLALDKRQ